MLEANGYWLNHRGQIYFHPTSGTVEPAESPHVKIGASPMLPQPFMAKVEQVPDSVVCRERDDARAAEK